METYSLTGLNWNWGLQSACLCGSLEIVKYLCEHGVDRDGGLSIASQGTTEAHREIAKYLRQNIHDR